jgi:hypothetical protein
VIILEQINSATEESLRTMIKEEIGMFEQRKIKEKEEKFEIELEKHFKNTTMILLIVPILVTVLLSVFTKVFPTIMLPFVLFYPLLVLSSYFFVKSKKERGKKEIWLYLNSFLGLLSTLIPLFYTVHF